MKTQDLDDFTIVTVNSFGEPNTISYENSTSTPQRQTPVCPCCKKSFVRPDINGVLNFRICLACPFRLVPQSAQEIKYDSEGDK